MTEQGPTSGRDGQWRSGFTTILEKLCGSCAGAVGAGLADEEGEAVDIVLAQRARKLSQDSSALKVDGYHIKLACAHWQILVRQLSEQSAFGSLARLHINTLDVSYIVQHLTAGYVLLLACRDDAITALSMRALRQAEVEIAMEAGWDVPHPESPCWRRVRVRTLAQRQPRSIELGRGRIAVTNVRSAPPVSRLERRFDVDRADGVAASLVRETCGNWYLATNLEQFIRDGATGPRHDSV